MGTWTGKARETPGYAAYAYFLLMLAHRSDTGETITLAPMFGVDTGHGFARPIASVRTLVDGADTGIALHVEGTMRMGANASNSLRFMTPEDQLRSMGDRLLAGRLAQLDLLDDQGAVIRSYHFDLVRLHDAPPVLAQAEWKCGDAVNR